MRQGLMEKERKFEEVENFTYLCTTVDQQGGTGADKKKLEFKKGHSSNPATWKHMESHRKYNEHAPKFRLFNRQRFRMVQKHG